MLNSMKFLSSFLKGVRITTLHSVYLHCLSPVLKDYSSCLVGEDDCEQVLYHIREGFEDLGISRGSWDHAHGYQVSFIKY